MQFERINCSYDEFNHFVMEHPYGSFYQTTHYVEYEKIHGFDAYQPVAVGRNGQIEGGALIQLKPIPHTPWFYAFLRKGFVMDYDRPDRDALFDSLWSAVIAEMKAQNVIYFRFCLPVQEHQTDVLDLFRAKGARHKGFFDNNQFYAFFRFNAVLDVTPDEKTLMKNLSSTNRRWVKKSQKYGLQLSYGTLDDCKIYQKLKDETAVRNHISSHTLEEAETIYREITKAGTGKLYLVKLVPEETLKILHKDMAARQRELKKLTSKETSNPVQIEDINNAIEKLEQQIAELEALKQEKPEGVYLSAALTFGHGEVMDYLFAGSSSEYRDYLPNYLMLWQIIKDAKAEGYKYVDFGGTDPESRPSPLSEFKLRWGCKTIAYSGDFDYVVKKPWGNLFRCLLERRETKRGKYDEKTRTTSSDDDVF